MHIKSCSRINRKKAFVNIKGRVFMLSKDELEIRAVIELEKNPELYKLVDFLNKNLKEKGLIFGLAKNCEKMKITVYNS